MKAFTDSNSASFTNPAHIGSAIFFFSVGIMGFFLPELSGIKKMQESLTQVLSVFFIILGWVAIYYSCSLRLQVRNGILEFRDALRQTHFCRLVDVRHVTLRHSAGHGRRNEFIELHYREGGVDYYWDIPCLFERKFINDLRTWGPPEPPTVPPDHGRYFRAAKGGSYHAEFGSYLPGIVFLIPILIAAMFSAWYLLFILLLIPFFSALGSYRLIFRGEEIIYAAIGQEYRINQREITDCTAREPDHNYPFIYGMLSVMTGTMIATPMYYDLVVNGRDIYRIPDGIFPNKCYVELLTFNRTRA